MHTAAGTKIAMKKKQKPDQMRGKSVMLIEEDDTVKLLQNEDFAIILLLSLLNQPLYLRSIAHLEQLLNLLEVVVDNAESNASPSVQSKVSPLDEPFIPREAVSDAEIIPDNNGYSAGGDTLSKAVYEYARGRLAIGSFSAHLPEPEAKQLRTGVLLWSWGKWCSMCFSTFDLPKTNH